MPLCSEGDEKMAAMWSLRAGSASSCPAALGNRGHAARLPGAAGTALAYITLCPPSWAWLGALSTMPCIQALAKGLPNAQVQGTGRLCLLCCNFLITAKKEKRGEGRKRAGSRGVGNSKKGLPDEGLSCFNPRFGFNKWLLFTNHFKALQRLSKRCFYI